MTAQDIQKEITCFSGRLVCEGRGFYLNEMLKCMHGK